MRTFLASLSILTSFAASAQSIEINPNGGTNASAILDLKSTTKGFLLPRMTNAQMRAIPSPAQGLLAFCTDCSTNGDYFFYKGADWVALGSTTVSVSTTVGSVGLSANENGATITNGVLNLAPADATNPGIVTKTAQTFGGVKTFNSGIIGNVTGNVTGNAATVTTNANLTGVVTSTGNATSISNGVISNAMLANGAVANLSGTNTGDNAVNSLYSGLVTNATHTGDVTGSTALTITDNAVTTAKIAAGAITDSKVTDVAASKITGILPLANGGTGTSNGSITGTGALTFAAGGSNQNISITPSGTGSVGIGTSSPNSTAALDLTSTTQGFLPPRLSSVQRDAIKNPTVGLVIFNSTSNCLEVFRGVVGWFNLCNNTFDLHRLNNLVGGINDEFLTNAQQTSDRGYIISGYSSSSANGDVSGTNHGYNDYWIVKLDVSGYIVWNKLLGGSGTERATDIQLS